jgi:hypothetical protein
MVYIEISPYAIRRYRQRVNDPERKERTIFQIELILLNALTSSKLYGKLEKLLLPKARVRADLSDENGNFFGSYRVILVRTKKSQKGYKAKTIFRD